MLILWPGAHLVDDCFVTDSLECIVEFLVLRTKSPDEIRRHILSPVGPQVKEGDLQLMGGEFVARTEVDP